MKFAIFIALCLFSQCMVTQAIYITCRNFYSFKNEVESDGDKLTLRIDSANSLKTTQNNKLNSLDASLKKRENAMDCVDQLINAAWSTYKSTIRSYNLMKAKIEKQDARIRVIDTVNPAVYQQTMMLALVEAIQS